MKFIDDVVVVVVIFSLLFVYGDELAISRK
jgi:hypothetical protein